MSVKIEIHHKNNKRPEIRIGQFWRYLDDPNRVFIVCDTLGDKPFSLIELNDGESWTVPVSNIENIFGDTIDDFELIENAKITIDV